MSKLNQCGLEKVCSIIELDIKKMKYKKKFDEDMSGTNNCESHLFFNEKFELLVLIMIQLLSLTLWTCIESVVNILKFLIFARRYERKLTKTLLEKINFHYHKRALRNKMRYKLAKKNKDADEFDTFFDTELKDLGVNIRMSIIDIIKNCQDNLEISIPKIKMVASKCNSVKTKNKFERIMKILLKKKERVAEEKECEESNDNNYLYLVFSFSVLLFFFFAFWHRVFASVFSLVLDLSHLF